MQSTGFTATSVSGTTLTTSASVTLPTGVMLFSNSLNYAGATIATGGTGTTFTITNPGSISFSGSAGSNAFLPELNVTALNPYTITGATYVPASGAVPAKVSFVVSAAPGFIEGSEFTISGITPSGYNRTYVADGSTTQSGTTIVGIPVTGPAGNPQPLSNPGAYSSGGTMVSVVMPGTRVLGIEQGNFILPYGSNGGTGTGGIGTYALNNLSGNTNTLTVTAVPPTSAAGTFNATTPSTQPVVVGTKFTQGSNTYTVTSVNGGGNFGVDTTTGLTTGTGNMTGVIGSAGSPVTLFAWPGHYYSAVAGTTTANPYGGVVTARTNGTLGDIFSTIGSNIFSVTSASGRFGWWGALGNVSMLHGPFPQTSGGAPDTTKLASLCTKATDLNSFASANGLTVHSLYRLDDPGMFADSSLAKNFTASITGASGTTGTLNVSVAPQFGTLTGAGTAVLAGPGVPGCPNTCPTFPLGSGPTYTLTWGSSIAANLASTSGLSAGNFKPAAPNMANSAVAGLSGSTLTVSSIPGASFTAALGNGFIGHIDNGTIGTPGTTLTVTSPTSGSPAVGIRDDGQRCG